MKGAGGSSCGAYLIFDQIGNSKEAKQDQAKPDKELTDLKSGVHNINKDSVAAALLTQGKATTCRSLRKLTKSKATEVD